MVEKIKRRWFCILLAGMLAVVAANTAWAARRVALIIGNGGYAANPLENPANDARDVAAKLRELGFAVIVETDVDKRRFITAMEAFHKELRGADAGLFFYAGHGMQVRGENYLLPVGTKVNREADVEFEAVNAGRILAAMEDAGAAVNVVILDACRDNPFKRSFRSSSRGLAMIRAPQGSFVAYATAPGDVAADGSGRNGVFTKHLLKHIDSAGLTIEDVFRNVRGGVLQETGGLQTPWDSSSLTGRFLFVEATRSPAAAQGQQVASVAPTPQRPTLSATTAQVPEEPAPVAPADLDLFVGSWRVVASTFANRLYYFIDISRQNGKLLIKSSSYWSHHGPGARTKESIAAYQIEGKTLVFETRDRVVTLDLSNASKPKANVKKPGRRASHYIRVTAYKKE